MAVSIWGLIVFRSPFPNANHHIETGIDSSPFPYGDSPVPNPFPYGVHDHFDLGIEEKITI